MKEQEQYKGILQEKIEKRIRQMESKDYSFPERMTKKKYIFWGIVVFLCLFAVILGAWL